MRIKDFALPIMTGLIVLGIVFFAWVGYYGSDDMSYAAGGLGWLYEFPYVGISHWTLRHTIVVPMAGLFRVFGKSELTLVLPVTLYFFALLGLVYVMMRRYFDDLVACIAVFVLGTLPVMVVAATTVVPDFAEVFFCLLSLSLFFEATHSRRQNFLLMLAGIAAGFSWLTRETVVFFLLTYGILFLVGFGIPRRLYLIVAAGFLAVVCLEFGYFALMTGDPLYRIHTDLATHLGGDILGSTKTAASLEHALGKVEGDLYGPLSRTGNVSVSRFIDPFMVVLVNQEFMFLYYVAVPPVAWIAGKRLFAGTRGAFLAVFGLAGLIWFACIFFQLGMTLLPRYYMLPTVTLVMGFSAWVGAYLWPRSQSLTVAVLGFLFLTSMTGIYVDNKDPIFGERRLVEFLQGTDEIIHTDPETARRGKFLYEITGVEGRIVAAPPQPGRLYFFNPRYVVFGSQALSKDFRQAKMAELAPYRPAADWQIIWHKEPERRWIGSVIDGFGLKPLLPTEIYRRVVQPNFAVTVYRP